MRLKKNDTVALVIDIQKRLLPHMSGHVEMMKHIGILLEGMKVLQVPVLLTEQYRKGLGETVQGVREHLENFEPMEKMTFSCCDDNTFALALETHAKKNVVICGIETHVCVLQTTVDLLEKGYQPVVIEDCTSSRTPGDKAIAIERMRQEGAIISSYESVLFELARISGTPDFKAISKLVK
jgi:nicotinamidase-related amidase